MSASPRSRRPRRSPRPRRGRSADATLATAPEVTSAASARDLGGSALAGVLAVLASWLVVVVPTLVGYLATADAPALGQAGWSHALGVATGLHLLGSGAHVTLPTEGTTAVVGVVPFVLTALLVLALRLGARRQDVRTVSMALCTVGAVAVTHLAMAFAFGTGTAAPASLVLGSLVVGAAGVAWANPTLLGLHRAPVWARDVLAGAGRALAGLAVVGLGILVVALVLGRDEIAALHGTVAHDGVGTVLLTLLQLTVLPDLVVWALSYAAGPGFAVGVGTSFTTGGVVTAPLPAVPVLGALPRPGVPGFWWLALLVVAVGLATGWWLARRRPRAGLAPTAGVAAGAGLVAGAVGAVLGAAATGPIGPGRMAHVGVPALELGAVLALEIGVPAVLLALALHPATSAALRGRTASDGAGVVGEIDEPDEADAGVVGDTDATTTSTHGSSVVEAEPETEGEPAPVNDEPEPDRERDADLDDEADPDGGVTPSR